MREFRVIFIEFMKELKKRDVSIYAGNTSFFMLLSGIPLLIVLSRLVLRLGITEQDFATFFSSLAPASFASTIHNAIIGAYHLSASLLPLSIVVLIWSCAQGMISLMHGLNKVYDVHHDAGFLVLRLVGMMYTLLLMIMMLFIIAFILLGDDFFIKIGVMQSSIRTIYQWRFVILFVFGVILITLVYKLVPRENQPILEQVPGALFTMLAWALFTKIFSLLTGAGGFGSIYGKFSAVILGMIWMYSCVWIILVGGYINWYFRYVFRTILERFQRR